MELRSLKVDFDNDVLEINGEPYKKKIIVDLPASDGWKLRKLFNGDENNFEEKSDRLDIDFISSALISEEVENTCNGISSDFTLQLELEKDKAYALGIGLGVSIATLLVAAVYLVMKFFI